MNRRERVLRGVGTAATLVSAVSLVVSLWLIHLNPPTPQSAAGGASIVFGIASYVAVGGFLVYRRPTNAVGWLILVLGFCGTTNNLATQYARYGLFTAPGALPGAVLWAWYAAWSFQPVVVVPLVLILVYPDGRLLSPRWRWLAWTLVVGAVLATVPYMISAQLDLGQDAWNIRYPNPLALALPASVTHVMQGIGNLVAAFVLVLGAVTVVLRYRRAASVQRLQMKWFAWAAVMAVLLFVATGPVPVLSDIGFGLALAVLPIGVAIAVLRYRLYDIDRIINRTLVYAVLTAVLVGIYAGLVLGLEAVVGSDNAVVVAGSTLVVAALFNPLRRRLQSLIDRRFYRRKYDAERTLVAFGALLRDQVDLDELTGHLVVAVRDTVQPHQVSLWLRGEATE